MRRGDGHHGRERRLSVEAGEWLTNQGWRLCREGNLSPPDRSVEARSRVLWRFSEGLRVKARRIDGWMSGWTNIQCRGLPPPSLPPVPPFVPYSYPVFQTCRKQGAEGAKPFPQIARTGNKKWGVRVRVYSQPRDSSRLVLFFSHASFIDRG